MNATKDGSNCYRSGMHAYWISLGGCIDGDGYEEDADIMIGKGRAWFSDICLWL